MEKTDFRCRGGVVRFFLVVCLMVSFAVVGAQAVPNAPTVTLPTGHVTDDRPSFSWRGDAHSHFQIRVTTSESPDVGIIWDSGEIASPDSEYAATADLPADTALYAFVRLQNAQGWGMWNSRHALFRVTPVVQPAGTLHTYDLRYTSALSAARSFEDAHLVSALQGIVNRDQPRLYIFFVEAWYRSENVDEYWYGKLREEDRWLAAMSETSLSGIVHLVNVFRNDINGVVLWDPAVEATSNVASTVAGVDNLLPIRYDPSPGTLYDQLVANGPRLPVVVNLAGKFTGSGTIPDTNRASSGSRKCDAYIWAIENYLKPGKCDPAVLGYYMDAFWIRDPSPGVLTQNHTLSNQDYFIAERAFIFDLLPWANEKPVDDPGQPLGTDNAIFREILLECYNQLNGQKMIHVGGFTPWAFKYTNVLNAGGNHGGVDTEWEMVKLCSAYNGYLDADALHLSAMANASLYRHMVYPDRYSQQLPPMFEELLARGLINSGGTVAPKTYLLHYVGDYDSAGWVTNSLYLFWDSPARGDVKMNWAINPNLGDRARPFMERAWRTRTGADFFQAGDSGAGYVNPEQLIPPRTYSNLPSAYSVWQRHCAPYYRQFDLDFTGFLINGLSGQFTPPSEYMYTTFSTGGIVQQRGYSPLGFHLRERMPVFEMKDDLAAQVTAIDSGALNAIAQNAATVASRSHTNQTEFLVFRSVLNTVEYYQNLNEKLATDYPQYDYEFCSVDEFSYLARAHLGGENVRFATYLFDSVPDVLQARVPATAEIAIRNDGWDPWIATGENTTGLAVEFTAAGDFSSPVVYTLPRDVPPGDSILLTIPLPVPDSAGEYVLRYEMRDSQRGYFSAGFDTPWSESITVSAPPPVESALWMFR